MTKPTRIQEIEVELENNPGTLAEATRAISEKKVNILGFSCIAHGDKGTACFLTNNPEDAAKALKGMGLKPRTHDVLYVEAPNKPGELARLTQQLAKSGVNIERSFVATPPTGSGIGIGFAVDDVASAEKVLKG